MIYLNKKQFLPSMIFISIMFLPMTLTLIYLSLWYRTWKSSVIAGILLIIYLSLTFCFLKISKSTQKHLVIKDQGFEICCGNKYCDKDTGIWRIAYREIEKIDYFKISSLKGWFSLWTGLFPRCVFITIRTAKGIEDEVFIGYLDLKQAKTLASIANAELIIH